MKIPSLRRPLACAVLSSISVHADSFLSETLVRKGQVQNVLEHQPVKHTSCQNAVVWLVFLQPVHQPMTWLLADRSY